MPSETSDEKCRNENLTSFFSLQEKALKYVETLSSAREMSITDGVTLVGNGSPRSARSYEPLSLDPENRETEVDSRLVTAAADLLENHTIQLRMPKQAIEGMKRSLEEGMLDLLIVSLMTVVTVNLWSLPGRGSGFDSWIEKKKH